MSQQLLTTGIKINVDATDLDIKFAKSADALNKTLTKSQKALGLFYDEQGRLVNSTGQVVEGLSQAQIKLGQYVDELGRTRSFQGGFVDGLNASQKALGMFKDELGNVYDRFGELIIESERAKAAIEELNDELEKADDAAASIDVDQSINDMRDAAQGAMSAFGSLGGQVASVFGQIAAAKGGFTDFTAAVAAAGQGVATFTGAFEAFNNIAKYLDAAKAAQAAFTTVTAAGAAAETAQSVAATSATAALAAQRTATIAATGAQTAFNAAANANPYVAAASAILAIASAAATYFSSIDDGADAATTRLDELVESAKNAGREIKNAFDAAKYGAESHNFDADTYNQRFEDFKRAKAGVAAWEEYEKKAAAVTLASSAPGAHATDAQYAELRAARENALKYGETKEDATSALENASNAFLDVQAKMLDSARDATLSESDKIRAEIKQYEAMRETVAGTDKEATVNKYIEKLNQDLAAAEQKALDEAASAAEPQKSRVTEADYTLDSGALADAVASGRYTLEEAQEAYQGALEREAAKLDELGITDLLKEAENAKTPLEKLADQTQALDDAYKAGIISQEKYNEGLAAIDAKRAEAQKAIDDEAKNNKRADLGIDAALDAAAQSKADKEAERVAALSPEARYDEAIAKYSNALSEGTITQDEYNTLAAHAAETKAAEIEANEKALEREREEERARVEKERADLRNESGIDALIESLKSPYEKYLDKLDGINNYLSKGAVTSAEAQLLAEQAYMEAEQAYLDASNGANSKLGQALAKPVATAKDGSAELYKMQLAQQNDKTAQMIAVQKEVLSSSQNMALYMFNMQRDIAMMATGWPGYYGG